MLNSAVSFQFEYDIGFEYGLLLLFNVLFMYPKRTDLPIITPKGVRTHGPVKRVHKITI